MFKKLDNMRFIVERFILNILLKLCLYLNSSDYSYLVYKIHVIIKLWHIVQILNNEH